MARASAVKAAGCLAWTRGPPSTPSGGAHAAGDWTLLKLPRRPSCPGELSLRGWPGGASAGGPYPSDRHPGRGQEGAPPARLVNKVFPRNANKESDFRGPLRSVLGVCGVPVCAGPGLAKGQRRLCPGGQGGCRARQNPRRHVAHSWAVSQLPGKGAPQGEQGTRNRPGTGQQPRGGLDALGAVSETRLRVSRARRCGLRNPG